jgi:hypothetical protein
MYLTQILNIKEWFDNRWNLIVTEHFVPLFLKC